MPGLNIAEYNATQNRPAVVDCSYITLLIVEHFLLKMFPKNGKWGLTKRLYV